MEVEKLKGWARPFDEVFDGGLRVCRFECQQ